ncbi:hypothetical protein [Psychromonas sp. SP041]|uniref:hypothetical protein n=1 Tax=Psychromonas sp. SP041 TaxID=1365007 RepID=UPI00046FBF7F|nr:hypothetical protein [Psychromonas sp. SP041]
MTYFISMLLLLITLSSNADSNQAKSNKVIESKPTVEKPTTQVPHNNGTGGLLKNTIIEPIENFNSISKKTITPKAAIPKATTSKIASKEKQQTISHSAALPTQRQQKVEIKTKENIKESLTTEK